MLEEGDEDEDDGDEDEDEDDGEDDGEDDVLESGVNDEDDEFKDRRLINTKIKESRGLTKRTRKDKKNARIKHKNK
eukprot:CAMPEP_0116947368 /NCGR_PEP_ID=MMETSP0467-20121206/37626_1 /TAXON_ID=283647 /ORGANISM="Mesodinium pulex, Strain SPMC105" /LENGTH=75 /DNA_ID=CAMNT_0004631497 /DNA_START=485 /DNA_END=712 /DNA_ORIENTATION=-